MDRLTLSAPAPCGGSYAAGFAPVVDQFAAHLRAGKEIGAGLTVYHRGECVVDLWGGLADRARGIAWTRDTRAVVFSATKGLAAMALALLADRGQLDWDAPVASYWPGFAANGKQAITVRTLVNHRAGLVGLDEPVTMEDCILPERRDWLVRLLERQRPAWPPDTMQGYHAITFGMYVRELFERIAGDDLGAFLQRELFEPLAADVSLGTPAEVDPRIASLYALPVARRLVNMLATALRGGGPELRMLRVGRHKGSLVRSAFRNPRPGPGDPTLEYNSVPVRRAVLAWASATASAHGLARAYVPFACGGTAFGRSYLQPAMLGLLGARQSWSERDLVLQKPIGWSLGFVKEGPEVFSPRVEAFGHPGLGGALGWCDPVAGLSIGYVMNKLDWRIRSPRTVALCKALYTCEPLRAGA